MTIDGVQTVGLIGAGHIGSQVARAAIASGYDVVISNSRGPQTLAGLVSELGPQARAGTAEEAANAGDLVVVAIPLRAIGDVPAEPLVGKVVIDTNNYYPQRDGHIAALDDGSLTSSGLLQERLSGAHVVKAFNHIYAHQITSDATPPPTPDRRALVIAGDDLVAKAQVARADRRLRFRRRAALSRPESEPADEGNPGALEPFRGQQGQRRARQRANGPPRPP